MLFRKEIKMRSSLSYGCCLSFRKEKKIGYNLLCECLSFLTVSIFFIEFNGIYNVILAFDSIQESNANVFGIKMQLA